MCGPSSDRRTGWPLLRALPAFWLKNPARAGLHRTRVNNNAGLDPADMETEMARIAGVNIPTNKRVVIALQYIHGIGPKFASEIVEKVGIPAERRVNQLTDAEVLADPRDHRPRLPGRRRPAPRSLDEHQAPDGSRLLSRPAPSPLAAGSRPAHAHQRPHPQGSGKGDRRQEEVIWRQSAIGGRQSRSQTADCRAPTAVLV